MRGLRAAVLAAALLAAGCSQTFDATTLGVPATLAGPAGQAPEGTPFRTSAHTVHGVWGLFTLSQANMQKALARQLVGAQQLAQVRIRTRSSFWDLLVTGLTLGLIVPRTVTFEGVAVPR